MNPSATLLVLWLEDIALNFNTSFYEKGVLIVSRRAIARNYMSSWLLFDVFLVLGQECFGTFCRSGRGGLEDLAEVLNPQEGAATACAQAKVKSGPLGSRVSSCETEECRRVGPLRLRLIISRGGRPVRELLPNGS